jgi:N-acetylglucosamine malate deacetylase 1
VTGRRVLILIPHPDDEVVGCAVAARRARAQGASLWGLYLTTGIPSRERLWPRQRRRYEALVERRRREAIDAAGAIGIAPVGFLDWPSRTLKSHLDEALERIDAAVDEHGIEEIWTPAWEGAHQDHDAANCLASRARVCVVEFAEYNLAGGQVRSQTFAVPNESEDVLDFTAEERQFKRALLSLYRSERSNLRHIRGERESLRPLARYDYAAPPHGGTLFWERFQWVPFRHPRVDFDRPEAVRAVLAEWAGRIKTSVISVG